MAPSSMASDYQIIRFEELKLGLLRVMPNQLFTEATTTLLMPSVRSLGPLTMEQVYGNYSRTASAGAESLTCLATGYGSHCSDCPLFCFVLCLFYEKRDPFKVMIALLHVGLLFTVEGTSKDTFNHQGHKVHTKESDIYFLTVNYLKPLCFALVSLLVKYILF